MRVPRVYGNALDVYTWQNNYLNNSLIQVAGGSKIYVYIGARQTCKHDKLII